MSRFATSAAVVALGLTHAVPASTFIPSVRRHFPLLRGDGAEDHVALTFDDGPDPDGTPRILEVLDRHGVKATFFLLGEMVERSPALARRLADEGHEIALHGWHHRNSLRVPPKSLITSLRRAVSLIEDTTGVRPLYYRPPYGVISWATLRGARQLGLSTVLWGAWGKDWSAAATGDSVFANVRADLSGGVTILLHDSDCTSAPRSWLSTVAALDPLFAELTRQRLRVGTLGCHLGTSRSG